MKKTNVIGMSALIGGLCMFGFHELGGFMGASSNLNNYNKQVAAEGGHKSLYDILDPGNFDWIDSIPWDSIQDGAIYVVNMPLWLLLVIVGSFLLIVGGIFIKK